MQKRWKEFNLVQKVLSIFGGLCASVVAVGAFGLGATLTVAATAIVFLLCRQHKISWLLCAIGLLMVWASIVVLIFSSIPYTSLGATIFATLKANAAFVQIASVPLFGAGLQLLLLSSSVVGMILSLVSSGIQILYITSQEKQIKGAWQVFFIGSIVLDIVLASVQYPFVVLNGSSVDVLTALKSMADPTRVIVFSTLPVIQVVLSVVALELMGKTLWTTFYSLKQSGFGYGKSTKTTQRMS